VVVTSVIGGPPQVVGVGVVADADGRVDPRRLPER
jgi:hypothetical protein